MEHYIVNADKYSGLLLSCDVCEAEIITIVRKTLTCLVAFCWTIIPHLKVI